MGLLDRPGQSQRYGLLSPDVTNLINSVSSGQFERQMAPAPAPPQRRERVSPWRVLDGIFSSAGDGTFSGSLDRERARLEQEAMRPQMAARQAQLRQAAESMGPAAMLAFDLNPEKFGENLAEQYAPQVIAGGGVQSVIGSGQRVSAPRDVEFGNSLVRLDPMSPQPQTLMTRGPTIQEDIARSAAEQRARDDEERRRLEQQRLGLDRDRFGSDAEFRQAQLDLERDKFASAQNAPRPGDNEDRAAIAGFQAANARFEAQLRNIAGDPRTGTPPAFDLSPANAARYKAALATGIGMSPEAAAYGDYVSEIESAVSEALRLNTGPQTDQDAIREARALLSNVDNREYVLRRLPTVMANNDRMRQARERLLAQRRPAGGAEARPGAAPAAAQSSAARVAYDAQGRRFVVRNGQWVPE